MLQATVSGSFHRHMQPIVDAVSGLTESGVRVLSPADPRVVDHTGEFLFVASDRVRSIRMVQDRHLQSIRASNFLWLVAPDGYVGQSASLELGFAYANSIPILSLSEPYDLTLRQYVHKVPSLQIGLETIKAFGADTPYNHEGFWVDPHATIQVAQQTLEKIDRILKQKPRDVNESATASVYGLCQSVVSSLAPSPSTSLK